MDSVSIHPVTQPVLTIKRWFILMIFCFISFLSAYQWNNLIIIPDQVLELFNSSMPASKFARYQLIDFISTSYQLFYIILMVPSSIVIAYKGLRTSGMIAICLIFSGCWIKSFAVYIASSEDAYSFSVLLFGQLLCAFSNAFVLATPSYLSSVWFGDNEMALATSIGVLGNQLGIAFGFFVPPLVVSDYGGDFEELRLKMLSASLIGSILSTIAIFFVFTFYRDQPKFPPNKAQIVKRNEGKLPLETETTEVVTLKNNQWKSLFKRMDFMLLTLSYGIMVGVFYGISTLIDKMLESCFKDFPQGSGIAGTIIVVSGIFGSVICGFILQKTRKFKIVNLVVYLFGLFGMIGFLLAIEFKSRACVFIMSGILGFFMTGYLPLGYEFAAEITFPINEDVTSGILSISAQVFGIILVIIPRVIIQMSSVLYANIFLILFMVIGVIMKCCIKERLRRPSSL